MAHKNRLQEESSGGICAPAEAVDPVCAMNVSVTATALSAEFAGTTHYFCGPGCRDSFMQKNRTQESRAR